MADQLHVEADVVKPAAEPIFAGSWLVGGKAGAVGFDRVSDDGVAPHSLRLVPTMPGV